MGGTFLELLWTLNTGCSLAGGKYCDDYRDFHGSSGCLGTLFWRGYPKGKSSDSLKEPQNPALEAAVKMASHSSCLPDPRSTETCSSISLFPALTG